MADKYGFSDLECKIMLNQIERRAKFRKEFLKLKTDPCKHSKEAGFVKIVTGFQANAMELVTSAIAMGENVQLACPKIQETVWQAQMKESRHLLASLWDFPRASIDWKAFDKAIQHFLSMKVTTLDYFTFNMRTIRFALLAIVMPMSTLGYALYTERSQRERDIRCGIIKPRNRRFKLQ